MRVKQISVFVENQPGRLTAILEVLAANRLSMRALKVSDTSEFGIVRMIVDDPDTALRALHEAGFTSRMDWILSAEIPNVPGGLLNSVVGRLV